MMHSTHPTSPPMRTWRDIPQAIAPRAMSSEGRRRMLFRTLKSVSALLVFCLGAWGVYEVLRLWEENPTKIKAPVKSQPVKAIVLRTDGVLDVAWVKRALALPKSAGLMELDLFALQARLMESGQVRGAVLARKFPDTLSVVIEERSPVARILAQSGDKQPRTWLVARDGVVFAGIGHGPQLLETLPYLDGVKLRREQGAFLPIAGMETVADLLGTAHANIPHLYRNWQIVSLERFDSDGEIVVRSRDIAEIVFGTHEDFYKQVAQLDLILEDARVRPDRPALRSVNLAVGGAQVPVAFETPGPLLAGATDRTPQTAPASVFVQPLRPAPKRPVFFSNLRSSNREF